MAKIETADVSPEYWNEYTNLQKVKHDLIKGYLNGWLPKLAMSGWWGKIMYLDTHAGRGVYKTGEMGSPLVALTALLSHKYREQLLKSCEVIYSFLERDPENLKCLLSEIEKLGTLPEKISVVAESGECFSILESIVAQLEVDRSKKIPAFIFVDPYGFKVPGALLRRLMAAGKVELFINIIWRELDMAVCQPDKFATTLDGVFDGDRWRALQNIKDFDMRADKAVDIFQEMLGCKWATAVRMLGNNNKTRYMLLHFTNRDEGRDLMKDCVWKVCPDGGFYARKKDDPNQVILLQPTPDLSMLEYWVLNRLREEPCHWNVLVDEVRGLIWREAHLNQALKNLKKKELIDFEGERFASTRNPLLKLKIRT